MTPIQQMLLGVGASEKTYVDNIFDTTLYVGNESSKTVTTGIDLATDGGLIIGKSRGGSHAPFFYDTVRGVEKYLRSDVSAGEVTLSTGLTAFSTTGFSVGSHVGMNDDVKNAAWSFKKTPGFFDIVSYTGNGTAGRTISHNLGCVPGMMMVKRTDTTGHWIVYHKGIGTSYLALDEQWGTGGDSYWNATHPTSTQFTVSALSHVNASGGTYVAYLFAGGGSTASTARSVDFDGSGDYLSIPTSTDFDFGSGEFTVECWVKGTTNSDAGIVNLSNASASSNSAWILYLYGGKIWFGITEDTGWDHYQGGTISLIDDQWHHIAATREGNTFKLYKIALL